MDLKNQMESIIFLGGDENKIKDLARFFSISLEDTVNILKELKEDRKNTGIQLQINKETVCLVTNPLNGETINNFFEQESKPKKLSSASLETLSIIAYKQPVTKSEIEAIRSVSVDRMVQNLEERQFIRNCGKLETPGRPNLYEITEKFLSYLGISSIEELPDYFEIKNKFETLNNNDDNPAEINNESDKIDASSEISENNLQDSDLSPLIPDDLENNSNGNAHKKSLNVNENSYDSEQNISENNTKPDNTNILANNNIIFDKVDDNNE